MAADGSIIIETNLDDKKAQQELNRLTKKIDALQEKLNQKQGKQSALAEEARQIGIEYDRARKKLEQMQSGEKFYTSAHIQEQANSVKALETEWNKTAQAAEKLRTEIYDGTQQLNSMKEDAGEIQRHLAAAGPNSERMSKAMERMQKSANKFSLRLREVVRSALIFTVISQGLASLRDWMGKVVKTNDEATAAIARLKGALLTLAQPLVNVIIPAFTTFVNILTQLIMAVASVISILFGTTIEQSVQAAEGLYEETEAIESIGSAARSAKKDLAAFDEINKLTGDSTNVGGGGNSNVIAPDFSALENGILSNLTFTLEDILFKWNDLTVEDILAKIITLLTTVAGGIIGFTLGGVGGAVIGIMIGAGLGLLISDLTFNGDGKLDTEELLKSIILVLGMIAGGVVGFALGGPGGAAIGVFLGAGVALAIGQLVFNGDGQLDSEEIVKAIVVVLGAIVGGIAGFMVGGPGGAAIGILLGAGIALSIGNLLFNGDGQISQEEIVSGIVGVLGAIVGGIIGFVVGGPGGALVGVLVGAGATIAVSSLTFDGDGVVSQNEILNLLINTLVLVCGGLLGFVIGGPAGALIGIAVAAGINLLVKNVSFSDETSGKNAGYEEGRKVGENVEAGARDSLGTHSPSTEFKRIGDDVVEGLSDGISDSGPMAKARFSSLLNAMEVDAQTTTGKIKGHFKEFLSWLSTEFFEIWNTTWTDCYNKASQNIQGVIAEINALNAKLASIERNITITITTVYKTVGKSSSGSSSSSRSGRASARSVSLPMQNIPALARGAVIPPNREFLAVLGDQKSGTNVEAPLDTIVQAVMMALTRSGMNADGQLIENVINLDGEVIYRNQKKVARRHGMSLTNR